MKLVHFVLTRRRADCSWSTFVVSVLVEGSTSSIDLSKKECWQIIPKGARSSYSARLSLIREADWLADNIINTVVIVLPLLNKIQGIVEHLSSWGYAMKKNGVVDIHSKEITLPIPGTPHMVEHNLKLTVTEVASTKILLRNININKWTHQRSQSKLLSTTLTINVC